MVLCATRRGVPRSLLMACLLPLCLVAPGCGGGGGGGNDPSPKLFSVSPDSGFLPHENFVTLTGSGFLDDAAGTNEVQIGGVSAMKVTVLSDTELTCFASSQTPGSMDVTLTNDNGTVGRPGGFTFFRDPPAFSKFKQRLDTDDAGTARSDYPTTCCDGEHVYAAWHDARNGEFDIYFNYSEDGGSTWQSVDQRLDSDVEGDAASEEVEMCCDGATVYVLWHDERDNEHDVFFNRSTDGGASWLQDDVRVNQSTGAAVLGSASVCCEGSNVFVVWSDRRNGKRDIYFNRSTDGGLTWRVADTRIGTDTAGAAHSHSPKICCRDGQLSVAWYDDRDDLNANAVYFSRSTDGGTTWLGADVRVDHDQLNAGTASTVRICCGDRSICVVWSDDRSGKRSVFANRSTDGGLTWGASDQRLNTNAVGTGSANYPEVCCDGTTIGVVWRDSRSAIDAVHFNGSTNAGATWLSEDKRVNETDAATDGNVVSPRICCEGDDMFVVWGQSRDGGTRNTYFNRSRDAGLSWLADDLRLESTDLALANSSRARICCDGARVHVVWKNGADGADDIYYNGTVPN